MAWDGSMFGYAPGVNAVGTPGGMPAPAAPPPAVSGATQPPGQQPSTQQLVQMLQQMFGNAGGAQGNGQAGNNMGGSGGGNAAGGSQTTGYGPGGSAAGWNWGPNQGIDLGQYGAGALQAATMLPKVGTIASLAQMLMRGYNTANSDAVRSSLGAPNLDIGQVLGSVFGLNNYGSLAGNQTFTNNSGVTSNPISGAPTAVTQGGMYDQGFLGGGPFGMFSDMRTAYTPAEYQSRKEMAKAAAQQALYNAKNGYSGGSYGNSAMPGGNFQGGMGAAGTVAGGQYGNQDTGGMAGPVNRSDPSLGGSGMLSRI